MTQISTEKYTTRQVKELIILDMFYLLTRLKVTQPKLIMDMPLLRYLLLVRLLVDLPPYTFLVITIQAYNFPPGWENISFVWSLLNKNNLPGTLLDLTNLKINRSIKVYRYEKFKEKFCLT